MKNKTYVLVHGAYHGGWCWRYVADLLRAHGHRVFTPTLTGLGERAHLLALDPDLDTHVEDIAQVIVNEELQEVILVGHSYGGAVVTGVVDRMPETIAHLVYLDALILQQGHAVLDTTPPETLDFCRSLLCSNGGSGAIPIPPLDFFAVADAAQCAWLTRHLTPQPVATFFSKMHLQRELGAGRPVSYIACTEPYFSQTQFARDFVKTMPHWNQLEIATGHDAMVTAPRELADLFNRIA